jgi:hypothetical protein
MKVVKALRREDEGVTHAAIDMVCALMHPMHDNYDLRQEQLNKSSLLSSSKFLESLLAMWISHVVSPKRCCNIMCLKHLCRYFIHSADSLAGETSSLFSAVFGMMILVPIVC